MIPDLTAQPYHLDDMWHVKHNHIAWKSLYPTRSEVTVISPDKHSSLELAAARSDSRPVSAAVEIEDRSELTRVKKLRKKVAFASQQASVLLQPAADSVHDQL